MALTIALSACLAPIGSQSTLATPTPPGGNLSGRVADEAGRPAGSARVRAFLADSSPLAGNSGGAIIGNTAGGLAGNSGGALAGNSGGALSRLVRAISRVRAQSVPETTTGPDGRFSLAIANPGTYNLEAALGSGRKAWRAAIAVSSMDGPADAGELRLAATGAIAGTVRVRSGIADDHTSTSVYIPGSPYLTRAGRGGAFELADLPAGAYSLVATDERLGEGRLPDAGRPDPVAVQPGQTTDVGIVALVPREVVPEPTPPTEVTPAPTGPETPNSGPTAVASGSPAPEPGATPTAAPSPSPVQTPTAAPSPTAAPTPTAAPSPSPAPTPTAVPSPTPAPTPAPTLAPTSAPTSAPTPVTASSPGPFSDAGASLVRDGAAAWVQGSFLYAAGGSYYDGELARVVQISGDVFQWPIDEDTGLLGQRRDFPGRLLVPRSGATVTVAGGQAYLIGGLGPGDGLNAQPTRATEILSFDGTGNVTDTAAGPSLIHARAGHATVIVDDYLYVLGGRGDPGDPLERTSTNADGTLDPFEEDGFIDAPRSHLAAAVVNGRLIAVGGDDPTSGPSRLVRFFPILLYSGIATDILGVSQEEFIKLPSGLAAHGVFGLGDALYVVGGRSFSFPAGDSIPSDEVLAAMVSTNGALSTEFSVVHRLPEGRYSFALAATDRWLYLVGGLRLGGGYAESILVARLR